MQNEPKRGLKDLANGIRSLLLFIGICIGIAFIIVGLRHAWAIIDLGFLNSEITAYSLICIDGDYKDVCKMEIAAAPMKFRISREGQYVTYTDTTGRLKHFDTCVINNRTNWRCSTGSWETEEIGFKDGKFFGSVGSVALISPENARFSTIRPVSKFKWYTVKNPL